jgi:hypothetical protein
VFPILVDVGHGDGGGDDRSGKRILGRIVGWIQWRFNGWIVRRLERVGR